MDSLRPNFAKPQTLHLQVKVASTIQSVWEQMNDYRLEWQGWNQTLYKLGPNFEFLKNFKDQRKETDFAIHYICNYKFNFTHG